MLIFATKFESQSKLKVSNRTKAETLKESLHFPQGICGYPHSPHSYGEQEITSSSAIDSFDFNSLLVEEGEEEELAEGIVYRAEPALVS